MKDCKIIRDLIPNYIDGLTSQESNEYIEKHLETCDECTTYLNDMKSHIELKEKETIKAEVDYMKKAKKKMNIGKKLLAIIGLLFVIIGMLFWREIYQGCMYADICLKYMYWQDQIINKGSYQLKVNQGSNYSIMYFNKNKRVIETFDINNKDRKYLEAYYNESDIPNTEMHYMAYTWLDDTPEKLKGANLKYYYDKGVFDKDESPLNPIFDFTPMSLLELMKTIKDVEHIGTTYINGNNYYIVYMQNMEILINKETGLIEKYGDVYYTMDIWENIEDKLEYPDNEDYIILADYEMKNRNANETNIKISDCKEEAGKIVNYNFKVEINEDDSLKYFSKTNYPNIKLLKINNNYTYKKIQERWKNLRDLTDDDFKNYFVILVVDTDNSKELNFKELGTNKNSNLNEYVEKMIYLNETNAQEEYLYSGNLIIIPNNMDIVISGAKILSYEVTIE